MFYEALHQKYNEYNKMKEQVDAMGVYCPEDLDKSTRNLLIDLVFLVIVYLALFMLAIYFSFKCSIVGKWGAYAPVLLILSMMLPRIGGFVIIGTVIYGSLMCGSICDAPRDFGRSFV